jgi:NADPH2:quinone reductase
MRAVAIDGPGGPEKLRHVELPVPQPGADEVLIDVAFAGVNFSEVLARRGQTPGIEPGYVPGLEVAGIIAATGREVANLEVGQPVAAFARRGGYAEFALARQDLTFALADGTRDRLLAAAVVPTTIATAYLILTRAASLSAGETVFVHAAAGALGSVLVQIANHIGAGRVFGVASSAEKADYARRSGYDDVFLRADWRRDAEAAGLADAVDVAVEIVGGSTFEQTLGLLAPLGRLVIAGNASWSDDVAVSRGALMRDNRTLAGFNVVDLSERAPGIYRAATLKALALLDAGVLEAPVERVLGLSEVAEAHAALERGTTQGKLVLEIGA